ncbi:MAG: 8-oxo-dGTP diphosphatase MutT [Bacteroidaceae bacterium]|nr:8-oxo-dGTP diphosphatase MutT [Bacteroidaceae bacterium]
MKTINVVAAIILDEEKRILATQRGYGEYEGWWEFPGGKIEPGEGPEVALRREIMEELGVEIAVENLLCTVEYDYPKFHLSMLCFMCRISNGEIDLREHKSAQWLSKETLDDVEWLPADVEVIKLLKE